MEEQVIDISCLTYQKFLLYFGRSCFLGIDIKCPIMFSEQMHDLRETWVMGCSCSLGPAEIQVSENGQKISRLNSVEPM